MTKSKTPNFTAQDMGTVVLLHGIGNAKWYMTGVEKALKKQGYETLNISYPSLTRDLASLTDLLNEKLTRADLWARAYKVHFVSYSMGGIIVRMYLDKYKGDIVQGKLGRVVMMAPPNGGSGVSDFLVNFKPYQWVFGPAGQELTSENQAKNTMAPYYEVGIIAGISALPLGVGAFVIPDKNDGCVALEKTKLGGMRDHIVLPATHRLMPWKPSIHKQILYFLKNGEFDHKADNTLQVLR